MEVWKTLIYQNKKYPQFSISNHGNLKNEKIGCRALARKFKVCHKTITQIIHKQTWRNI